MNCEACNVDHSGTYGSGRFCSPKCARSFSTSKKRKEINEKIRKALTIDPYIKTCLCCRENYKTKKKNKKYCSHKCSVAAQLKSGHLSRAGKKGGRISAAVQNETRRSKNEIAFANLCKEKFNNVICNKPIFEGWDADVILQDQKIAIHWNGPWHYRKITQKHSVAQVQRRDKIK